MRWPDERYVRVYTRDTVTWKMLPWQGKALLGLLFRKVDRAGLLDLGEHGAEGLAAIVELPLELVEVGLPALLRSGTAAMRGTVLVIPNFLEAQEAISSDAQRKRDQRERERAVTLAGEVGAEVEKPVTQRDQESRNVTDGHATGQSVTKCHAESRGVTRGHSVPSLAVPNQERDPGPATPNAGTLNLIQSDPYQPDLEAIYRLYPRKDGRKKGLARLKSIVRTPERYAEVMRALANYRRKLDVEQMAPQYVKHFDAWVTVWEDYLAYVPTPPRPVANAPPAPSRPKYKDIDVTKLGGT